MYVFKPNVSASWEDHELRKSVSNPLFILQGTVLWEKIMIMIKYLFNPHFILKGTDAWEDHKLGKICIQNSFYP